MLYGLSPLIITFQIFVDNRLIIVYNLSGCAKGLAPNALKHAQREGKMSCGSGVPLVCRPGEVTHAFGPEVHLLQSTLAHTWLAELGDPACTHARATRLIKDLYHLLLTEVIDAQFPRRWKAHPTRMSQPERPVFWTGDTIDRTTKVSVVDMLRAGMGPSAVCFQRLSHLLQNGCVRHDVIMSNRQVGENTTHVAGAAFQGSKIDGSVAGRVVLLADPMGATGTTISKALRMLNEEYDGRQALKVLIMCLIATPEFLRRLTADHPYAVIYALRLDRGTTRCPHEIPGIDPGETGLNEHDYIVPGLGDVGALLCGTRI
jgi:uracil phosphoribosyltransferase